MKREFDWRDVWTPPFRKDPGGYCAYIWDSEGHMCFSFMSDDYELYERIVKLLNGDTSAVPFKHVKNDDESIYVTDDENGANFIPVLLVRGWGHLTGQGALRMKEKDAKAFQKLLVEHCVKLLKHKEE